MSREQPQPRPPGTTVHPEGFNVLSIGDDDIGLVVEAILSQVDNQHDLELRFTDFRGNPFQLRALPHRVDNHVPGFVLSLIDIKAVKAAQNDLRRYKLIAESATDAIALFRQDGAIVYANPSMIAMLGYSQAELQQMTIAQLAIHQDLNEFQEQFDSAADPRFCYETQWQRADGDRFAVEINANLVEIEGERYLCKFVRDITSQQAAQQQLEQASRAIEQASRAKSEFLTSMSHELRTPMTSMLGFLDILRMESDDPEFLEKVDTIKRNGEYLMALISDILDLSKIEAGKVDIASESVQVLSLIEDVGSLMSVRAVEEGIPLRFDYRTEIPKTITGDRTRIRQILVNLIGNALKFTDLGEVRVEIAVDRESISGPRLNIDVVDTGIGMDEEDVSKLFQPFSQVARDTSRNYGGSGLGLSISKRLAERMRADIFVESEPGKGSRFRLSLPLTTQEAEDITEVHPHDVAAQTHGSQPGLELISLHARILLADDRRDVWRIAKYFLEKAGSQVSIAEDGRQAIDMALEAQAGGEPFEIILMDMQMPVMNGKDAVQELRKLGVSIPIIALTADAMEGQREACLAIGCDEFCPKPINGLELLKTIDGLLREREAP